MRAQKLRVMLESFEHFEVKVAANRGVSIGNKEAGKGEGPRACKQVVMVDHVEIIWSLMLVRCLPWVGEDVTTRRSDSHKEASGSAILSTATVSRSKVGRC